MPTCGRLPGSSKMTATRHPAGMPDSKGPKSLVGVDVAGRVQERPGCDEPGPEVRAHALAAPGGDEGAIGVHVRPVLVAAPAVDVVQPCPVPFLQRLHGSPPPSASIRACSGSCPAP